METSPTLDSNQGFPFGTLYSLEKLIEWKQYTQDLEDILEYQLSTRA